MSLKTGTMTSSPPPVRKSNMSRTHTTSTAGPIWAELASLTLQAFTPDLIRRLQSFIADTPSFDSATHIPLLASLVIRHITLSLRESALPTTKSFRDVAYHAVMSNRIITKRERSVVRAVSVGKISRKDEPVLQDANAKRERNGKNDIFPRASGKDCLQSASMRRLLTNNQAPLDISLLETPRKINLGGRKLESGNARRRERKRTPGRQEPPRNKENKPPRNRHSTQRSRSTIVCQDTSTPQDGSPVLDPSVVRRDGVVREPLVRRERPSRLVQLRRQRLERRKATIT